MAGPLSGLKRRMKLSDRRAIGRHGYLQKWDSNCMGVLQGEAYYFTGLIYKNLDRLVNKNFGGWSESVQLGSAGAVLGVVQDLVEGAVVEIVALEPDGLNLGGVVDFGEGIGGEENEVGALSGRDET
jgi:hypothetical protein